MKTFIAYKAINLTLSSLNGNLETLQAANHDL